MSDRGSWHGLGSSHLLARGGRLRDIGTVNRAVGDSVGVRILPRIPGIMSVRREDFRVLTRPSEFEFEGWRAGGAIRASQAPHRAPEEAAAVPSPIEAEHRLHPVLDMATDDGA